MIPELLELWGRWEETHDALLDCVVRIPDERLSWRPAPKATTAAEIIQHIARAEHVYAMMALGETGPRIEPKVSDRDTALQVIELGAAKARDAADSATTADLAAVRAERWGPLGPEVKGPLTGRWFFEQMIRHKAYHLGQLWYLVLMSEE
jgi:uncharacterized damage-inducible protein DinB